VLKLLSLPDPILAECATLHLSRNAMVELAMAGDDAERAYLLELLRQGASVKALREARAPKADGQGARPPAPKDRPDPVRAALNQVEKGVKAPAKTPIALDEDHRRTLQALLWEIDRLLKG
jgi:ParB family transcriptional regulator, chromosome partitioning protein